MTEWMSSRPPFSIAPLRVGVGAAATHPGDFTAKNHLLLCSPDDVFPSLNSRPRSEPNRNTAQRINAFLCLMFGFSYGSLPFPPSPVLCSQAHLPTLSRFRGQRSPQSLTHIPIPQSHVPKSLSFLSCVCTCVRTYVCF